jgi:hypothetical protein
MLPGGKLLPHTLVTDAQRESFRENVTFSHTKEQHNTQNQDIGVVRPLPKAAKAHAVTRAFSNLDKQG